MDTDPVSLSLVKAGWMQLDGRFWRAGLPSTLSRDEAAAIAILESPAKRFYLSSEFWAMLAGTSASAMSGVSSLEHAADTFGPTWGPVVTMFCHFATVSLPIAYALVRQMAKQGQGSSNG